MNYRHIFHAGNKCDIIKHALLVLCLDYLRLKNKSFFVLDTHAGVGLYDLYDPRALKTNEAQEGIVKLLATPHIPQLGSYYTVLKELNPSLEPSKPPQLYPGSPTLIYHMLRSQDRLVACELHPEDIVELRQNFHHMKQAHIHHRDGYEALSAFLPPAEKRGLVLIDPPFEQADELEKLPQRISDTYHRWPQGLFLVWYPIKERPALWHFHEALIATRIPKQLCVEFIYDEEIRHDRLNGSGCILINPPWQLDEQIPELLKDLHQALQTRHQGITVKWLTAKE